MAALVARWNACVFCTKAHGAVASRVLQRPLVNAALEDFRRAELPEGLRATLVFLEKLTLRPEELTAEDARAVLRAGVSPQGLEDAIAVAALFNVIARYADAFDFAIPGEVDLERAADRLLTRGYAP
jgi:alkylhydroperoxidase family enzyme